MGHDHKHYIHEDASLGNIGTAFFLNLAFTVIEFIGGALTNSMAILADAIHDLGDVFSLGSAYYFQKLSRKKSNRNYSYGYRRFSLMGAMINAVILCTGSILILINTIPRLFSPHAPHEMGMFYLAILGILVNGLAAFRTSKGKSINEKLVSLHLLEDVLGWAAILIGSLLIHFFNWNFIDPLLSILIALFILKNVIVNIRSTLKIILQGVPDGIDKELIETSIKNTPLIHDIHDLHIWSMDGNTHILSVHIVLESDKNVSELTELKDKVRGQLLQLDIEHATFEFEFLGENCSYENCCKN